jgi:hypothetical protein
MRVHLCRLKSPVSGTRWSGSGWCLSDERGEKSPHYPFPWSKWCRHIANVTCVTTMRQLPDCSCLVVTLCGKVCRSSTPQGKSDTKSGLQVTKCTHNQTALVPSIKLSRPVEGTLSDRICVLSFSVAFCFVSHARDASRNASGTLCSVLCCRRVLT